MFVFFAIDFIYFFFVRQDFQLCLRNIISRRSVHIVFFFIKPFVFLNRYRLFQSYMLRLKPIGKFLILFEKNSRILKSLIKKLSLLFIFCPGNFLMMLDSQTGNLTFDMLKQIKLLVKFFSTLYYLLYLIPFSWKIVVYYCFFLIEKRTYSSVN